MTEFTIHIDSAGGLPTEEGLSSMHEGLGASPTALGAAVSADLERGAYSATFQVEAPTIAIAAAIAEDAFGSALELAGHDRHSIAAVEISTPAVAAA